MKIGVLITCHNRKNKTLNCLRSIYSQILDTDVNLTVFLVDDGSTDGTSDAINEEFCDVNIIFGNGSLFWSGGMRLAFKSALKTEENFDFFLLINDDTEIFNNAILDLLDDYKRLNNKSCIIIGSTIGLNPIIDNFTYGGRLLKNKYSNRSLIVLPNNKFPQLCHLGNANLMLIPKVVIDKIGFFNEKYIHGVSDFDYTLTASKSKIPTYIASKYLGNCDIDNIEEWKSSKHSSLKERMHYLYSVKGLSYHNYLYFIRKHFPFYLPHAWILLWMKTIMPIFWDYFKKNRS